MAQQKINGLGNMRHAQSPQREGAAAIRVAVQLLNGARTSDVIGGEVDEYGRRYILDLECGKGTRRAVVRNAWTVLQSEDYAVEFSDDAG